MNMRFTPKAGSKIRIRCGVVSTLVLIVVTMSGGTALAALSEGRVYEQVSPEFKGGYPVAGTGAAALNGESVRFNSIGGFNGSGEDFALNPYLSRRTETGWATRGLFPAPTEGVCWKGLEELSPELDRFEYLVPPGVSAVQCAKSPTNTVWVRGTDGSVSQISPVLTTAGEEETGLGVVGGARDLSRVVIANPQDGPGVHLVPHECEGSFADGKLKAQELFETEACAIRLVGVDETGQQISLYCDTLLGSGASAAGASEAVSQPEASEVFFSVAIDATAATESGCPDKTANPAQLFVRVNGSQTLTISAPLAADCDEEPCQAAATATPKEAVFQGASEDGSKVFFTTAQSLVNEDKDSGNDLYMAEVGCLGATGEACGSAPREVLSLQRISRDPNAGQPAEVRSMVVAVSPDGSHVYFVAGGDLLTASGRQVLEEEGRAVPSVGAENLYVYDDETSQTSFVADLCSQSGRSGSVGDDACPEGLEATTEPHKRNDSGLWTLGRADHEAQTTPDGRFLVFSSYGGLLASGPGLDADSSRDVYRYDAQDGTLQRISIGETGVGTNGNGQFDASIPASHPLGRLQEQYELENRDVSANGSTVLFASAEPLATGAVNGRTEVYVWHEGQVTMISSGLASEPDSLMGITPSGRDVFFLTSAGLVPGDTDGLGDIYDARAGGGFPPPPAEREQCSGDACQGPLSTPAPLEIPASMAQVPGEEVQKPPAKATKKPKAKKKSAKAKKKKPKHTRKRGRGARKAARRAAKRGRRA